MKYCPICERSYGDEVEVCKLDGAVLRVAGARQDPFIGQMVKGRYRVIRKLGEGGMGTVYLAEQVSIGRRVALKVLHGQYARDEEFVRRFRQEARLAASLGHHNVVTIYDFDQGDEGSLFIAMEYVDGRSLKEEIQEGPLDVGRAARLGIQIAEGLGAAHRAGVIHRDIKPENIMVVREGDEVKLMDFGIARLRDTGTMARLTRSGVIMGTPAYMSPEQIEGKEISERTDIYAFGIVLYEMLSGGVPFKASTPGAVLVKHLQEVPVPLRRLRREIPSSVERVVMQALEKKPQRRQRSMEEVTQGLRKAEGTLVGKEIPKTLVGGKIKVERWGTKWKLVASILLVPVIVGVILWVGGWVGPKKPETVTDGEVGKVVSLAIYAEKKELKTNEHTTLRVKGKYSDGSEGEMTQTVEWRSSDTSVATVSSKGQVEGRKGGFADITANYAGLMSPPVTLFVKGQEEKAPEVPSPPVQVVSLTLHADKRELLVKERVTLGVKGKYSDGREDEVSKGVVWQSSDRTIAVVSSKGQVEGRKAGSADITARHAGIVSPPLTLVVKAPVVVPPPQPPVKAPEPKNGRIPDHIKIAKFYRERGEYSDAFSELEKARAIDPSNKEVQAEFENTTKACGAEKKLGRTGLPC
ncbi:MAG: protein kinase [Deltaproteobacteria bacterium]|nr:protein kinase [Deltaproteobacteria bacterium]